MKPSLVSELAFQLASTARSAAQRALQWGRSRVGVMILILLLAGVPGARKAYGDLYRIDIQPSSSNTTASGAEPLATAFNSNFGSDGTDFWNAVGGSSTTTNYGSSPLSVNLKTSKNETSGVNFVINGGSGIPIDVGYGSGGIYSELAKDYIATGRAATINFCFTGLPPGKQFYLSLYSSANRSTTRTADFRVDTDGNGTLDAFVRTTNTGGGTNSAADNVQIATFSGTTATSGTLAMSVTDNNINSGGEADWAGVQLYVVTPAPLSGTWNSATDVLLTGTIVATGSANLALGFAPSPGTNLTAINNPGYGLVSGTYSNLGQGQRVSLAYGGTNYHFVANYYGGNGNDLVLQWADVRPVGWGWNSNGLVGNNSATDVAVPTNVTSSGALSGKVVTAFAPGGSHNAALCSDGSVATWGNNSVYNELGNNSSTNSSVPVAVYTGGVLSGKTVVAISSGANHTLALCSDGTLVAWGRNDFGQLGNGTNTGSSVPVAVTTSGALNGKTVVAVSAGGLHSLALCSDGTVVGWGYNGRGQLGNNTLTDSNVPVAVYTAGALSGKAVITIAAGVYHSMALCADGTAVGWGQNGYGQLGNNSSSNSSVPVTVLKTGALSGKTITAVGAGSDFSGALCSDGTIALWGWGGEGEMGNGANNSSSTPVAVSTSGVLSGKTPVSLSVGTQHCLAKCSDGTVVAWGRNTYGELGNNSKTNSNVPVLVSTTNLASGEVLGQVYAGSNSQNSFGLVATPPPSSNANLASLAMSSGSLSPTFSASGTTYTVSVPNSVTSITVLATKADSGATISVSGSSALVVGPNPFSITVTAADGVTQKVYSVVVTRAASSNANLSALSLSAGALSPAFGSGTTSYTASVPFSTMVESVTATATDAGASVAITGTGSLPTGPNTISVQVTAADGATQKVYSVVVTRAELSATWNSASDVPVSSNGLLASGSVSLTLNFAPGIGTNLVLANNTGQESISGSFSNLAQGQIVTLTYGGNNYRFVANYYGGTGNDLVLQWANVRPVGWGSGANGNVGNNSVADSVVPANVVTSGALSGKVVTAIVSGGSHSLALCADGSMAAWGNDSVYGELGDNSSTNSSVPVAVSTSGVLSGKTVVSIAAGANHSLALCSDGTLVAWGRNDFGQLGNNSKTGSSVPVAVNTSGALSGKTVVAISAGGLHSLALCSDGTVVGWGYNGRGQLGNNSFSDSMVPVAVNTSGVLSGKTVTAVAAGMYHSMALCSDGTMVGWGQDNYGQLGNNSSSNSSVPVSVIMTGALTAETITSIGAGSDYSVALCSDGTIATWGWGGEGEMGNNSNSGTFVPVAVSTSGVLQGKTPMAIAVGYQHCLAECSDGTVVGWGDNRYGQLGNNSNTSSSVPVLLNTSSFSASDLVTSIASGGCGNNSFALVSMSPFSSNADLSNLAVSALVSASDPNLEDFSFYYDFSSDTTSYSLPVPNYTTGMQVVATPAEPHATIAVTGTSGFAVGDNLIQVTVTAQDGVAQKVYSITANRAAIPAIVSGPVVSDISQHQATVSVSLDSVGVPSPYNSYYYSISVTATNFQWSDNGMISGTQTVVRTVDNLPAGTTASCSVKVQNTWQESATQSTTFTTISDPVLTFGGFSDLSYDSLTLSGTVNPMFLSGTVRFFYGQNVNMTYVDAGTLTGGTDNNLFSIHLTGLSSDTDYVFGLQYLVNDIGYTSSLLQLRTLTPPPAITQGSALGSVVSAVASDTVNPNGTATLVYYEYGSTALYGGSSAEQAIGSGDSDVVVSGTLTGLNPSATYHYRLVAVNTTGTTVSSDRTFTTAAGSAPTIVSGSFQILSSSSLISTDAVNPNDSGATAVAFQYGSGQYFGSFHDTTDSLVIANANAPLSVTGTLTASHPVSYRLVAANASGTSYGPTIYVAAPEVVSTGSAANRTSTSFTVASTVVPYLTSTAYVEYGTSGLFGMKTDSVTVSSGTSATTVNTTLTGLDSGVQYHFRTVIANEAGTTYGPEMIGNGFGGVPLVVSGTTAPGFTGSTLRFWQAGSPAVNDAGQYAFQSTISGTSFRYGTLFYSYSGIWKSSATGGLALVVRSGSDASAAAPGVNGALFSAFSDPVLNNNGDIAFIGTMIGTGILSSNNQGIWSTTGGSLHLVARRGAAAPGCPAGAVYTSFVDFALADAGGAANAGRVTFLATVAGGGMSSSNALFAEDASGAVQLVTRVGAHATIAGASKSLSGLTCLPNRSVVSGQTRSYSQSSGDLIYKAAFVGLSWAFIDESGTVLIKNGDRAPGFSGTANLLTPTMGVPALNTKGNIAFTGLVSGTRYAISALTTLPVYALWASTGTSGVLGKVAVGGGGIEASAPGTGGAYFSSFTDPVMNGNDAVAFLGNLYGTGVLTKTAGISNNSQGLFSNATGQLKLIVRIGTQAPGCPTGVLISSIAEYALADASGESNLGSSIFIANLGGTDVTRANNLAVFAQDSSGVVQLIARTGDTVNLNGVHKAVYHISFMPLSTNVSAQTRSFSAATGELVYKLTFIDGSWAIFSAAL